jgi:tRNA threonylcarbamoyladenosine biosynthesis protein TsaE
MELLDSTLKNRYHISRVKKTYTTISDIQTQELGARLGARARGGEVFVLQSDLGGGKTTLTQGIATGIGSVDRVTSPTFTFENIYTSDGVKLYHYDFYRADDIGILINELAEALADPNGIIVIEWAGTTIDTIDSTRMLTVEIQKDASNADTRHISISYSPERSYMIEGDE